MFSRTIISMRAASLRRDPDDPASSLAICPESKSKNAGRIASENSLELPPDFADYLAQIHAQNMAHLQARKEKIRQMNTTAELNHA